LNHFKLRKLYLVVLLPITVVRNQTNFPFIQNTAGTRVPARQILDHSAFIANCVELRGASETFVAQMLFP